MPGPMSAPNGDRRLVEEKIVREGQPTTTLREVLRSQGKLITGKTEKKRK